MPVIDGWHAAPERPANPTLALGQHPRWVNYLWVLVATVCGAAGVLYFYRTFYFSGFTRLQGDSGDGTLTLGLAEHWLHLSGSELPWTEVGTFYPAPSTLGYSDTMLLNGLLSLPPALVGVANTYQFQISLTLLTAIGYGFAVAFVRTVARGSWPLSIIVAMIFTFGNGVLVASSHPQLITLQLLPVPAVLLAYAVRSEVVWKSRVWGLAAGLMFGAILYSAFYIGWFAIVGLSLTAVFWWVLRRLAGDSPFSVRVFVSGAWPAVLGFVVMLVPFAITYLPIVAQGVGRSSELVFRNALVPGQLLTSGPGNVLWSTALDVPGLGKPWTGSSRVDGLTPTLILLVVVVGLVVWALLRLRRLSRFGSLGVACAGAGLVLWVIPVKFGAFFPGGWLVSYLPGGSAIRAISRIELMAVALLVTALALLLIEWAGNRDRAVDKKRLGVALALCAVIAVEQLNVAVPQRLPVARIEYLNTVSAAPTECKSFAVTTLTPVEYSDEIRGRTTAQTDALIVAQRLGLPTWNGYSGLEPEGWNLFDPASPDYKKAASDWAQANSLQGGCGLSFADRTWLNPEQFKEWLRS